MYNIEELKKYIELISKKYDLKRVILFGSQADGTSNNDSDIDLLVEYNTDSKSLFTTIGLKQDIEKRFNKKVDIVRYPIPKYGIELIVNKEVPIYG